MIEASQGLEGLPNTYGNWVCGKDFYNRQEDLTALASIVKAGGHCLLTGQRRMGKTSLARELCRRLKEDGGCYCFFVDVESAERPEDLITELIVGTNEIQSLWQKAKKFFRSIGAKLEEVSIRDIKVKIRAGLDDGNWKDKGDDFFKLLANQEKPILLVIDELPIFINRILQNGGREPTDVFLHWLRKNAQAHKGKISIIISGSIGLEPILQRADLIAAINVFPRHELRPWSLDTVRGCLKALATHHEIVLADGVCEKVYEKLGSGIPHYVQFFFHQLQIKTLHRGTSTVSIEDVGTVYQSMLAIRGMAELAHYESRLKLTLDGAMYRLTLDMLTEAAVCGGLGDEALRLFGEHYQDEIKETECAVKDVLCTLEHDGYLHLVEGRRRFVLKLLEDWWSSRHKAFFIPIKERR